MTLTISDYEEVLADHKRLVREIDIIINGAGAAQQASLCDLVEGIRRMKKRLSFVVSQHHYRFYADDCGNHQVVYVGDIRDPYVVIESDAKSLDEAIDAAIQHASRQPKF